MIIHQLIIQNFKSYNGRHVIGPFDTHFNCVIGPNGNGKSNIIDSVLFAFGFKSSKLRQDSLASLIHKSAFAKPEKAKVQVIFCEGIQKTSISRTILKSGHSYYKLNGEKTGWNELKERLMQKKIDLNKNLFIILQGQVERLCELSPETMVQYLEYVSGSDEFKQLIDRKQKLFIETSIVREQNRISLNHKRFQFQKLKGQAGNQITWILLKLKVILYQHLNIKKLIFMNVQTASYLKQQQQTQLNNLKQLESQIKLKEEVLKEKKKEWSQICLQIKNGEQYLLKIEQKQQNSSLKLKNVSRQVAFIQKDKQKKQEQSSRYCAEIAQINNIKQGQKQFIKSYNQIKARLSKFKHIDQYRDCYLKQAELEKVSKEKEELIRKCRENEASLVRDREKLQNYEKNYKNNKSMKEKYSKQLKQKNEQRDQVKEKLAQNEELITQMKRRIDQQNNHKVISNQQKIIKEIKNANKLNLLLPNYSLSTLREFVIIDNHYLNVVQTLLPHLDYFIVDTVQQAQQITQYLNNKKIGRMTMLIKEYINNACQDIKIVENVPKQTLLIINVIKSNDQNIKNVLMWVLGSTLVTQKLDIAMKVAYYDEKKYRVITMSGEFIDVSGTMTKLSLKNGADKEDQEFLLKKYETLKKMQVSLQSRKKQLDQSIARISTHLQEIQSQQRSFDGLDQIFLVQIQKQIKQDSSRVSKLTTLAQKLQKELQYFRSENRHQLRQQQIQLKEMMLLLKNYVQNQQKIKKIESSTNLMSALQQKSKILQTVIRQISLRMEQKVREKVNIESQRQKYVIMIDQTKKKLQIIQYGKSSVNNQISALQKEIRGEETSNNSGQGNVGKGNRMRIRQNIKKTGNKLRQLQISQIQLKNNLSSSLKQIKQYDSIICKDLQQKYPQLFIGIYQDVSENKTNQQAQQIQQNRIKEQDLFKTQQDKKKRMLLNIKMNVGKNESSFQQLLAKAQRQYLMKPNTSNLNIYTNLQDIKLQQQTQQQMFMLLPLRQLQFSIAYEQTKIKHLQKQIEKDSHLKETIDFTLLQEYREKRLIFQKQNIKMNQITSEVQAIKNQLVSLRNQRLNIFMTNFNEINIQLNVIYNKLTGGKAQLNFIDSINPFQGVQFSVRPVNKSWKRVNLLSGGQKTFTSLALIFACEEIKKFPFYFMDEIDAALDYKNTTLLSQYLKEKTRTQHIVISLRKNMYQESNYIVGVYKIRDQSQIVQIGMQELQRRQEDTNND